MDEGRVYEPDPVLSKTFSPPWATLTLRSYLLKRTRHTASLIDCRLFSDMEKELAYSVEKSDAVLCAVNTDTNNLGETIAVLELLKRNFPGIYTLSYGQHPSTYPNLAMLPWVDFAVSGDPEPVLKSMLDFIDVPPRLQRTPGLLYPGKSDPVPYWLPNLKSLAMPNWDDLYWKSYSLKRSDPYYRVEARLSRGHTNAPTDRFLGGTSEPLRLHNFDRVAESIKKCGAPGIHEVHLADPPGFWTQHRIQDWCAAWKRNRSMQSWSLSMLPAAIDHELARTMGSCGCRRIEFIIPSCDPEVLSRFGCTVDAYDLGISMDTLYECNILSHVKFFLGGPEEPAGESRRLIQAIREMGDYSYSLHAFPFRFDSDMYEEAETGLEIPTMQEWLDWTREPRRTQRPVLAWGGEHHLAEISRTMSRVQYTLQRSPARLFRKLFSGLGKLNLVEAMEHRAASLLPRPKHPDA